MLILLGAAGFHTEDAILVVIIAVLLAAFLTATVTAGILAVRTYQSQRAAGRFELDRVRGP